MNAININIYIIINMILSFTYLQNGSMIIRWSWIQENIIAWLLVLIQPKMSLSLKMTQLYLLQRSTYHYAVLGITINSHLNFYSHFKSLFKKVANKQNTLARICPYLSHSQRRVIYNFSFTEQLIHCSLIMNLLL